MRRSFYAIATAVAVVATTALVGPSALAGENITSGGSSFANAILSTCAQSYTKDKITYASVGSGTGRTNFLNGTYDFGASDAAYAATAAKPANFTYVPLIGGPVAIIFNIPGVTKLTLNGKVLGGIMNGRYTYWDDTQIKQLNSKVALPHQLIKVTYRSDSSGTVQNFARYLRGNGASGYYDSSSWATASAQATPVGTSAANSQLLVSSVASTQYSIGYADLSDTVSKGLKYASLINPLGEAVQPSVKTASAFLSKQSVTSNGILDIDYRKGIKGGYNLSLVTYALAPTKSASAAKGLAIKNFLTYVISSCAPSKGPGLNYAPLSAELKAKALKLVATVK